MNLYFGVNPRGKYQYLENFTNIFFRQTGLIQGCLKSTSDGKELSFVL